MTDDTYRAAIELLMLLEARRIAEKIPSQGKGYLNTFSQVLLRQLDPSGQNSAASTSTLNAVDWLMDLAHQDYAHPIRTIADADRFQRQLNRLGPE